MKIFKNLVKNEDAFSEENVKHQINVEKVNVLMKPQKEDRN